MKGRIAIWTTGAIGNGNFSQGYPMMDKIVSSLSHDYDIIVYSKTPPNKDFAPTGFLLKYPPRFIKGKLCWVILFWYFLMDHVSKRFTNLIGFFGYPTGFFVVLLQKIFGVPAVISVLGADSASVESVNYGIFHRRFPRFISTWAYQRAKVLLAISEYQKETLQHFGINREIKVIPWGADSTMYKFSDKDKSEELRVIHVGHLNPVKDQRTLLKTFAIISKQIPARLKIFGLDCLNGALQKYSEELGIRDCVEFHDMIPYSHMPAHYQHADLMIHTSLSEGQCMALTEAAACGVLISGTRVGLLYDLTEECGISVNVGESELLASKILELTQKPEEWKRKVLNARNWSEIHTMDWTLQEISKLLESIKST